MPPSFQISSAGGNGARFYRHVWSMLIPHRLPLKSANRNNERLSAFANFVRRAQLLALAARRKLTMGRVNGVARY